jgi:DNA-binding transcriptional LysR family regulator
LGVTDTSDLGVLIELVAEQLGIAVLPRSALGPAAKPSQRRRSRAKLGRRILLVWRPPTTHRRRAVLALARHHLAGPAATPA